MIIATKNGPYQQRLKDMQNSRTEWENQWRDIADYILPRKGFFTTRGQQPSKGETRHDNIVDGTATDAMNVLASGMQGGLTSPARKWFRLTLLDEELADYGPIKGWLADVEEVLYRTFARTNFYSSVFNVYMELGGFGTGAMFEAEYWDRINRRWRIYFRDLTAGEYWLATDPQNRVDTLYRRVYMSARQIVSKFGDENVSDDVKRMSDPKSGQPDKFFAVIHTVQPRDDFDRTKKDKDNMPWESIYFEEGEDNKQLSAGGFNEFPYMVPRWEAAAADIYGRSPGMNVLPDVKMLQESQKSTVKAEHLMVEPPLLIPAKYRGKIKMAPSGLNYVDAEYAEQIKNLFDINFDVAHAHLRIDDTRRRIAKGLYNDLFLMLEQPHPNVTATEILERHEEKLIVLGPVIERQENELLRPTIDRTFNILQKQGAIPPVPDELAEQIEGNPELEEMKVEFVSLLAQAQKLVDTKAMNAHLGYARAVAETQAITGEYPEALDKINFDEALEHFADRVGLPPDMINPDELVQEIRAMRAQALQAQQAMQAAAGAAQTAKDLSQSDMAGENALTELTKAIAPV